MSGATMLKVGLGAMQSTLYSTNTSLGELENYPVSTSSELTTAVVQISLTEHRFCSTQDAAILMLEQFQKLAHHLCKVEGAQAAAELSQADAWSHTQSFTDSEMTLGNEVGQLSRIVEEIRCDVANIV